MLRLTPSTWQFIRRCLPLLALCGIAVGQETNGTWQQLAKDLAHPHDRLTLADGKALTVLPLGQPLSEVKPVEVFPGSDEPRTLPPEQISGKEYFEDILSSRIKEALGKKPGLMQLRTAESLLAELWRQHRRWRDRPPLGKNPWQSRQTTLAQLLEKTRADLIDALLTNGEWTEALTLADRWRLHSQQGLLDQATEGLWTRWGKKLADDGKTAAARQLLLRMERELMSGGKAALQSYFRERAAALLKQGRDTPGPAGVALLKEASTLDPDLPGLAEALEQREPGAATLRIATRSLPEHLSPATAASDSERLALNLLFSTFADLVPPHFVSGSVTLPTDLSWSNGWPLTAVDVQHTLVLLANHDLPGRSDVCREFLDCRAGPTDASRLQVTLRHGLWDPTALRRFFVLPSSLQARADDPAFATAPVGSGPFRVASRTAEQVVLRANPHHQRPPTSRFRGVHFQAARELTPDNAKVPHLVWNVAPKEAAAWAKANYRVMPFLDDEMFCLAVNHRVPVLDNAQVRQALALTLNRSAILDGYYGGKPGALAVPANGLFRRGSWAISTRVPTDLYNLESAASLAKKAQVTAVDLTLHYSSEDPLAAHACRAIADQVGQTLAGWKLKPVGVTPAALRDLVHQRQFALVYCRIQTPEALPALWSLFDPGPSALSSGGSNFLGYHNDAQLQILLRELSGYRQFSALKQKYHDLHAHLYERMPLIPLWQAPTLLAVHPSVQLPALDEGGLFQRLAEWKIGAAP